MNQNIVIKILIFKPIHLYYLPTYNCIMLPIYFIHSNTKQRYYFETLDEQFE